MKRTWIALVLLLSLATGCGTTGASGHSRQVVFAHGSTLPKVSFDERGFDPSRGHKEASRGYFK
jgi:hypothetical protein